MSAITRWGPLISWCALIFYLSSVSDLSTGLGVWDLILRKLAHIAEYAVLTWLAIRARVAGRSRSNRTTAIWAIVFSVLYAISDEIHQSFVPSRGPSAIDVLIDSLGVCLVYLWFLRKTKTGDAHDVFDTMNSKNAMDVTD